MTDFVVAVCTSRITDLAARWEHNCDLLEPGEFLVILDAAEDEQARLLTARIKERHGEVVCHGTTRGLSAARNSALDARPGHAILFVDDDVELNREAVDGVRAAFAGGAHVVGVRLSPPPVHPPWPWYFTPGQMHLVGWHAPNPPIKTWGACMGIDAAFSARHRLRFDHQLGRTGRRLESGDDTSYIAAMKREGSAERLLSEASVVHDVDHGRFSLGYLLRRSFWQGRSEIRRRQAWPGLRKEWTRHRGGDLAWLLPVVYCAAYATGIAWEFLSRAGLR